MKLNISGSFGYSGPKAAAFTESDGVAMPTIEGMIANAKRMDEENEKNKKLRVPQQLLDLTADMSPEERNALFGADLGKIVESQRIQRTQRK